MDDEVRDAYLKRLGVEAEPPSVDALFRLHHAHVERVPYETVWIHLGQPWTAEAAQSARRIALEGRGGYCFHVNGGFSELLRALGYDVTRHLGGVHGPDGPTAEAISNHLVLTVAGLPSDENPEGIWYADAGLGDALHDPLPLHTGEYQQGPFRYRLTATPGAITDWNFTHDPRGSFSAMGWQSAPAEMGNFAARHTQLSTSPESLFVQYLIVQRRDAQGVDIMLGIGLRHVDATSPPTRVLTTKTEWLEALADIFGLRFEGVDPAALDRVWQVQYAAHEEWQKNRAANAQ